jgi:CRP-like cAMP-binding protein
MPEQPTGEALTELLQQFRWFQKLDEHEARQAEDDISSQQLKAGDILFNQGEPGDSMYMVLDGVIEVRVQLPNGRSHTLSRLEPGAIFGEMSLLLGKPRNATAIAVTDAEICCITHFDFNESLEEGERWAGKFLMSMSRSLAERLSNVDTELQEMLVREDARAAPATPEVKTDELERLRARLLTDWNF